MSIISPQQQEKPRSSEAISYIHSAYEKICQLSQKWLEKGLIPRKWNYYRNETDTSDGNRYTQRITPAHWIPVAQFDEKLNSLAVQRYSNAKNMPVSLYLIFDMLEFLSLNQPAPKAESDIQN